MLQGQPDNLLRETNIIRDNPCYPWAKNQSFGVAASAGLATRSLRSLREKKTHRSWFSA